MLTAPEDSLASMEIIRAWPDPSRQSRCCRRSREFHILICRHRVHINHQLRKCSKALRTGQSGEGIFSIDFFQKWLLLPKWLQLVSRWHKSSPHRGLQFLAHRGWYDEAAPGVFDSIDSSGPCSHIHGVPQGSCLAGTRFWQNVILWSSVFLSLWQKIPERNDCKAELYFISWIQRVQSTAGWLAPLFWGYGEGKHHAGRLMVEQSCSLTIAK